MTGREPYPTGTRVFHAGQRWARTLPGGTGEIVRAEGPDRNGEYEYLVRTGPDFAMGPDPEDNPETDERWWPSYHVSEAWKGAAS
jgi:hypothetical protein